MQNRSFLIERSSQVGWYQSQEHRDHRQKEENSQTRDTRLVVRKNPQLPEAV